MHISLAHLIVQGHVDNTVRGSIVLRLQFVGREAPVERTFSGDCLRDLAGCRLSFENPLAAAALTPEDEEFLEFLDMRLAHLQPGDMTASRRLYDNDTRQALNNVLSLELLDLDQGGRILIESSHMKLKAEAPVWMMSEDEDAAQRLLNQDAFRLCLQRAFEQYRQARLHMANGIPMNDWDNRLCEAEARACAYSGVRDKYAGLPGGEISMAYVLGCDIVLERQAYADEHAEPPSSVLRESGIMLTSFLAPEDAAALQKLTIHPVYRHLAAVMEFFHDHAEHEEGEGAGPAHFEAPGGDENFRRALEKQAFITPLVLATLLAIGEGVIGRNQIAERCERLASDFDALANFLNEMTESWAFEEGYRLVRRVKTEFLAFCRETCKGL